MTTKEQDSNKNQTVGRTIDRKSLIKISCEGQAADIAGRLFSSAKSAAADAASGTVSSHGMFKNKVVLVTGATSGIGEATTREFAKEGAKVFFCGRRGGLGLQMERSIREAGGEATFMRAEIWDETQVRAFVNVCRDTYGRIDIAFNNAGVEGPSAAPGNQETSSAMGYYDLMKTKIDGVMHSMRYEIPVMREQGEGIIVNVGSMLSHQGTLARGAYAASKYALNELTRSTASKYEKHGIRILSISPEEKHNKLHNQFIKEGSLENDSRNNPMRRTAEPEEIVRVMMSMCLCGNLFPNGEDIKADCVSFA